MVGLQGCADKVRYADIRSSGKVLKNYKHNEIPNEKKKFKTYAKCLASNLHKLRRPQPLLLRRPLNLQPMLIRPRQENSRLARARQAGVSREDVCDDERVEVADVRGGVGVEDGRGDEEGFGAEGGIRSSGCED